MKKKKSKKPSKRCTNCKRYNTSTSKFCKFCGSKLIDSTSSQDTSQKRINRPSSTSFNFHQDPSRMFVEKMIETQGHLSMISHEQHKFSGIDKNVKYKEGLEFLEGLKYSEAIKYYSNVLKNKNESILWNNLGVAYMGMRNRKEALRCYENALSCNNRYYISWYNKGGVYYECKQYEEAIKCFDKAIEINPKCGEAYNDKMMANEALGRFNFGIISETLKYGVNMARPKLNKNSALIDLGNGNDEILGSSRMFVKDEKEVNAILDDAVSWAKRNDIAMALKQADNAVYLNPSAPGSWFYKGQFLAQTGKYDEAIEALSQVIDKDPLICNPHLIVQTYILMASVHSINNRYEEALHSLNIAEKIDPFLQDIQDIKNDIIEMKSDNIKRGLGWHFFQKGLAFAENGNYISAIQFYDKAIELEPDHFKAWLNKGLSYFQLNQYNEAKGSYEEAIKINPEYFRPWEYLGIVYYKLGNYEKSREYLNKALDIDMTHYSTWVNKAQTLYKMELYQEALSCYDNALQINPDDQIAQKNRMGLFQEVNKEAFDELIKDAKNRPIEAVKLVGEGSSFLKSHTFSKALNCFRKALEIDQTFGTALSQKGDALKGLGRLEEAVQCYEEAIKLIENPRILGDCWINMGVCLKELGRYQDAIESYENELKVNPDSFYALLNLGNVYMALNNKQKAIESYDKCLAINPSFLLAMENRKLANEL